MKKIISQFCSISILATSLNVATPAFAAESSRSSVIRDVLATYSMNIERAEGTVKSVTEAALALQAQGITGQELIEYAAEGMEPAEARSYRHVMASRLAVSDGDNMTELLAEVSEQMGQGANFRGCSYNRQAITFAMGITSISFAIAASSSNNSKRHKENDIQAIRLQKTDLESDINILIGEGVKPESFLIASIKKDIAYMDEEISQKQADADKNAARTKTYAIVAGASGAIWAAGFLSNCY